MSGPNNLTRVRFVGNEVFSAEAPERRADGSLAEPQPPAKVVNDTPFVHGAKPAPALPVRPGPAKTADELKSPPSPFAQPVPPRAKPPKFVVKPKSAPDFVTQEQKEKFDGR